MPSPAKGIIRVSEPGYVPAGVTLRARIDETMFTASFDEELLATLQQDPKVVSVEVSQRLRSIG